MPASMLDIVAVCLAATALLAYLNHRFVGLPTTVGVMAIALVVSLAIRGLDAAGLADTPREMAQSFVRAIDFSQVLLQGMLSLLLFAGAMHVKLAELRRHWWQIAGLAVVGTVLSTLIIGAGMWYALPLAGLTLPLAYCFLFGALISPTDPVAVVAIMRSTAAPRDLEIVISGESLFNDGVGVVLFALVATVVQGGAPSAGEGALLLLREAGGGLAFGWLLGYVTYRLLKSIDQYQVEVLLTLAAVVGGYALAAHLHVSGPLAMVVAGVVVGDRGRAVAMSDTTREYVDMFWELIDEILNAVLFVLIGMEVLLFPFTGDVLLGGLIAVAVTLAARWLSVGAPVAALHQVFHALPNRSWRVLTWGGLRGGISVALALSLPPSAARDLVLALTYCVVVVSILVQGLTIGAVVRTLRQR
jgi:monovalent cation:H+ antiporter, CPA1 family